MNTAELTVLLDRLRAEPRETEWLEFKSNRYEPQVLGEYLSALSNSAGLLGKPRAYLVFGIEDGTHTPAGTSLDPASEKGKGRLVEGRFPHPVVAAEIAAATGQKARHIRDKGFDNQYYRDLILQIVREHQPVSREDIDRLLLDKLPEVLTREQKRGKVHNLMMDLARKQKRIVNQGSRRNSQWVLSSTPVEKQ